MRWFTRLAVVLFAGPLLLAADTEFKEFSPKGGRFKVQLPGTPKEIDQKTAAGLMKMYLVEHKNGAYLATFFDVPDAAKENAEQIEKRLDGARDGAIKNVRGKLVSEKMILLDKKHPGRDFVAEVPAMQGLLRAKIYAVEGRFFMVMTVGTKEAVESKDSEKFLDSLELVK